MTVLTGLGWDSHRLVEGRPLILGGVEIPSPVGLAGHSDADVLTHALIDALLGAAGLGDIGEHFPDSDERWRDADSLALLEAVVPLVTAGGFQLANADTTVVLERPHLGPHKTEIGARLAGVLGLTPDRVNVKASTAEGMGFVGRGEGIVALAIVTLERDG